ncbi:MAG: hypothetical protein J3R72DRAFT_496393 [Linnemannia gamsii]|nr:MAG: hypothetical protein J3R72DRAFT_496393 [Linnemannia gamsii]
MSAESQSPLRTHVQIDNRVPPEIWEQIFSRLYPSQLSRMSMVNSNFNKIVSSLSVWSRMFSLVFGPTVRLRTLPNMPESKSYMLYLCASSLYVCEQCFVQIPFEYSSFGTTYSQPVLAPLPTMTKGNIKYLGEELNLDWKVWMCTSCRYKQPAFIEVGDDKKTRDRILWYRQH